MALFHSPRIATNNLTMYLDAANTKSYSGSGTAWNDLSGNGNNGTLTNGPIFSSSNKGSFLFDGTNDYVNGTSSSSLYTGDITVEAWIKIDTSPSDWVRIVGTGGNTGGRTFGLWYSATRTLLWQRWGATDPGIQSDSLNTSSWYYVVATTSGSSHVVYVNGAVIGSASAAGPWAASNETITIGYAGFHTYITGSVGVVRLYTLGLTQTQVLQNFNALRGRYGI